MPDQTDKAGERDWISGTHEAAGDSIIGTLFTIIVVAVMMAALDAIILFVVYLLLGIKRSIADTYFHGDPPFPIDATIAVLAFVVIPLFLAAWGPISDWVHADRTLLAIRANRFGQLKPCPDQTDFDGDTIYMDIKRILFHASDTGTIRVYAENSDGPVFLTLRLDNGRMRIEGEEPVSAAFLYEAKHGGGKTNPFIDPRCSYSDNDLTVGRPSA